MHRVFIYILYTRPYAYKLKMEIIKYINTYLHRKKRVEHVGRDLHRMTHNHTDTHIFRSTEHSDSEKDRDMGPPTYL